METECIQEDAQNLLTKYKILENIGEGTYGKVYKAQDI